jgi:isocitrate lyase
MSTAEAEGKSGAALQSIEDAWVAAANLQVISDTLADALKKQGTSDFRVSEFKRRTAHVSNPQAVEIATKEFGLRKVPYWDWDAPRTREGFYRYKGGTQCAVNRAVAFAPYADMLWMETKSPILAQAKEFAMGVHNERPGHWLAYNLSPSFNWDAAGMGTKEIKDFVWELGKLGFVWQFITVSFISIIYLELTLFPACGLAFERLYL